MKKVYLSLVAACFAGLTFSQTDSLTFESFDLQGQDYYNGSDLNGSIVINQFTLTNNYNTDWGSWDGFAISRVQDSTTAGWQNQYASFAGSGANGSEKYAVWYGGEIEFAGYMHVSSMQVTNTTYTALTMRDGDAYSKQFGSINGPDGQPDGTNGEDWFLLEIIPM